MRIREREGEIASVGDSERVWMTHAAKLLDSKKKINLQILAENANDCNFCCALPLPLESHNTINWNEALKSLFSLMPIIIHVTNAC